MLLLDTHVLVWHTKGLDELGAQAKALADSALLQDALLVSAITFWEVAMRIVRGRLTLMQDASTWRQELLDQGLIEIPVAGNIALMAAPLPDFHRDPAARFITATALHDGAQLVTADERLLGGAGTLQRHNAR